jgi:DNA repair photolyase
MDLHHWSDFERKIYVKQDAATILRRDLARGIDPSEPIALATASDLYQPAERTFRVTRSLLEVFAEFRGLQITLATKSDLVIRDIDLVTELSRRHRLRINISVTTPRLELARRLEPRAPTVAKRMEVLRALREAGLPAGILIMPVLPCLTDSLEDLDHLIRWAAECGTGWVGAHPLWLRSSAAARFYPFLQRHAPHLVERYRRCYDRHMHAPAIYREWLGQRIDTLRERHRIPETPSSGCDHATHRQSWTQPALFGLD